VLESGDRLVATARDPRRLDDLVNRFGERVRAAPLDVADESAAQVVLRLAASDSLPAHLLIGSDAVRFAGEAEKTREAACVSTRRSPLTVAPARIEFEGCKFIDTLGPCVLNLRLVDSRIGGTARPITHSYQLTCPANSDCQ
jgi:hypothetical protein